MNDWLDQTARLINWVGIIFGAIWAAYKFLRGPTAKLMDWLSGLNNAALTVRVERLAAKITRVIDLHQDAIYVCLPNGYCVWASNALGEMFGLSCEQMEGNGWASAIDHRERSAAVMKWRDAVLNDTPYRDEYTVVVGGERQRVETEAKAHKDANGKVLFYVGSCRLAKNQPSATD